MTYRIACLMGTYGRYTLACESLACFLQQTVLDQAHLFVLNQHPVSLRFEHPNVTVVNQQMPGAGVRMIRLRMLELVDPGTEFIHFWDDDDLYLPWHLEDGLREIGTGIAWRPARSWVRWGDDKFKYFDSYEASVLYRAEVVRTTPIESYPRASDHPVYKRVNETGQMAQTDLGGLTSYVYCRHSSTPQRSEQGWMRTPQEYGTQMETIRAALTDAGPTTMVAPDLWPRWSALLSGVRHLIDDQTHLELETRLTIADAMSKLGASS